MTRNQILKIAVLRNISTRGHDGLVQFESFQHQPRRTTANHTSIGELHKQWRVTQTMASYTNIYLLP